MRRSQAPSALQGRSIRSTPPNDGKGHALVKTAESPNPCQEIVSRGSIPRFGFGLRQNIPTLESMSPSTPFSVSSKATPLTASVRDLVKSNPHERPVLMTSCSQNSSLSPSPARIMSTAKAGIESPRPVAANSPSPADERTAATVKRTKLISPGNSSQTVTSKIATSSEYQRKICSNKGHIESGEARTVDSDVTLAREVSVCADEPVEDKVLDKLENDNNKFAVSDNDSSVPLLASSNSSKIFEGYLICCIVTPEQREISERLIAESRDPKELAKNIQQILNHPDLFEKLDGAIDGERSGKLRVLHRLVLSMEERRNLALLVSSQDCCELLRKWVKGLGDFHINIEVLSIFEVLNDNERLGNFDSIVLYEQIEKGDLAFLTSAGKTTNHIRFYRLFSTGTLEEREFLDNLVGVDLKTEATAKGRSVAFSGTSEILSFLKERDLRLRRMPDEEFAELWPILLHLGWHAEGGSGLIDYFYCKPNFTSKSSKSHKQKGKKHEDFFVSKERVLQFLKTQASTAQRLEFVYGLHDLAAWTSHINLVNVRDPCVKSVGEDCISNIFALHGAL